jgi:hypothetical protein
MNALFKNMPWFIPTAPSPKSIEGVNQLERKVEMYRGGDIGEKGLHVETKNAQV